MDQDSVLTADTVKNLLKYKSNCKDINKVAIISPNHILQDNKFSCALSLEDEIRDDISTMSSGNLVNLRVWELLGGYREDYFIDMVDIEYYVRAKIAGYKVITLINTTMVHQLGQLSLKKILFFNITLLNHSPIRKYYQIRNSAHLCGTYRKSCPGVKKVKSSMFYKNIIKSIFFEKNKFKKIYAITLAIYHYKRGISGKLKNHSFIMK